MKQTQICHCAHSPSIHRKQRKVGRRAIAIVFATMLVLVHPLSARAADDREVVSRVKPVYPEIAKRMKIAGTVLLHATVEPDGKVKSVTTVMGNTMLSDAAKEAVIHWKFAPAERQSVEDIEIEF